MCCYLHVLSPSYLELEYQMFVVVVEAKRGYELKMFSILWIIVTTLLVGSYCGKSGFFFLFSSRSRGKNSGDSI